jgi:hypothetical protein
MSGGEISGNTTSSYGGGVYVGSGTFTMNGGEISGNTTSTASIYGGGGVYVSSGTCTMNGGEISGNTTSSYGGGVSVVGGTFTKTGGGTIYGYVDGDANSNVVKINDVVQDNRGHAVYVDKGIIYRRESTAEPEVDLDSSKSGTDGGWEN